MACRRITGSDGASQRAEVDLRVRQIRRKLFPLPIDLPKRLVQFVTGPDYSGPGIASAHTVC